MENNDAEILRKADALLAKRRSASILDFPVLTDVVANFQSEPPLASAALRDNFHYAAGDDQLGITLAKVEQDILERINDDELRLRISASIEELVRSRLSLIVDHTIAELRDDLAQSLLQEVKAFVREVVQSARNEEASDSKESGPKL